MAEIIQPREPEAVPANNEGNASQSQPREADQGLVATPINDKVSGQPTNRRATGPRTELGKTRSSRNAIKSGIFSRATLLEGESGSEYQSLLDGLWKALGPEGELEEILVQKLVSISWRYHRLLVAECAEIRKNSDFLEFDLRRVREQEAEEIAQVRPQPQTAGVADDCLNPAGLIWNFENPDVLARCLELLVELKKGVMADAFVSEENNPLIRKLYGHPATPHHRETLHGAYSHWLVAARMNERERVRDGYSTPEQCKRILLREIRGEINRLQEYQKTTESIETERMKVEILRQRVPDSQGLDRLVRYETSLERGFDRTLSQLERAQRMRNGQPLPPQIDVKIT